VQADGGLAAGLAMLACLTLVFAATIQPRGLFNSAVQAGAAVRAAASMAKQPALPHQQAQHLLAQPQ
jgi:hypothetical protein